MGEETDILFMQRALELAEHAFALDEVPVGAVVVMDGEIVGEGYNRREMDYDPTAHAEIMAIRKASERIGNWRLENSTLYVTKEPCIMCCGAVINARIGRIVFGCRDEKGGAAASLYRLLEDERLNHVVAVESGLFSHEAADMLRRFFRGKRL